jgi:hypothetical protein
MSRWGNCWDTQSKIALSAAFGLTRTGIEAKGLLFYVDFDTNIYSSIKPIGREF